MRYVERKRLLEIEFESDSGVEGFWGVSVNTGSSSGWRYLAVAPVTARCDDLASAVTDGSAAVLPASGRATWRLTLQTSSI